MAYWQYRYWGIGSIGNGVSAVLISAYPFGPHMVLYGSVWSHVVLLCTVLSRMVYFGPLLVATRARPIIDIIGIGITVFFRNLIMLSLRLKIPKIG